ERQLYRLDIGRQHEYRIDPDRREQKREDEQILSVPHRAAGPLAYASPVCLSMESSSRIDAPTASACSAHSCAVISPRRREPVTWSIPGFSIVTYQFG